MTADTRHRLMDGYGRLLRSFQVWRGQRPFWGGLLTLLAGIPIMYIPYHALTLGTLTIRMSTTAGAGSLIIGVLLIVLGLTMWFQPHSRVFAGVAAILLALVSLVVSNFGAFLVGFTLGLVGGALGVSWAPGESNAESADQSDATGPRPDRVPEDAEVSDGDHSVMEPASQGEADANGNGNGRHRAG